MHFVYPWGTKLVIGIHVIDAYGKIIINSINIHINQ